MVDPVSGLTATPQGLSAIPSAPARPAPLRILLLPATLTILPARAVGSERHQVVESVSLADQRRQLSSNFAIRRNSSENRNAFDTRLDVNFSDKNQMFYRFSYVDDPQFIPGIFGAWRMAAVSSRATQTALAQQSALAWTHVFSPTMVNVARAGLNYLHTTRVSPSANDLSDIPAQFGIQGIPQEHENGGLPAFGINGLQTLGSNAFLPSDEVSSTFQVTDDFTKIYGKHTFKMGFEFQHVKFSTLQPPWSRGEFDFDGVYTDIPSVGGRQHRPRAVPADSGHQPRWVED